MKINRSYLIFFSGIILPISGFLIMSFLIAPRGLVYRDNLALRYYKEGLHDKAIREYKEIIEQDPYIIPAYLKLGLIYHEKGLYDKAMKTYEDALEKDPNATEILHELGIVYLKKGFYNKARQKWERVLEIEPDFLPARKNLEMFKKNVK